MPILIAIKFDIDHQKKKNKISKQKMNTQTNLKTTHTQCEIFLRKILLKSEVIIYILKNVKKAA